MDGLVSIERNGYLYLVNASIIGRLLDVDAEVSLKYWAAMVIKIDTGEVVKSRFGAHTRVAPADHVW